MTDEPDVIVDRIVERILVRESSTVDHPSDPGGLTKWGITLPWLSDRLGHQATPAELLGLTREQARVLYTDWIRDTRLAHLCRWASHEAIADAVIDWAVQTTPSKAVKQLQTAFGFHGTDIDGILGPKTVAAYDAIPDPRVLLVALVKLRIAHRVGRVKQDHSQLVFLDGWTKRDLEFL